MVDGDFYEAHSGWNSGCAFVHYNSIVEISESVGRLQKPIILFLAVFEFVCFFYYNIYIQ